MGETGKIIDTKNNGAVAVISFNRTEACAKCKACMAGFQESQMILEAKNSVGAKLGDIVEIELPNRGFVTASAIMYLIPLAAMMSGFFCGLILARFLGADENLLSFLFGFSFLLVCFPIIRFNENRLKSLSIFVPYISKISISTEASDRT